MAKCLFDVAHIKKNFNDDVTVLEYLSNLYKQELKRVTHGWDNTTYRATRKNQLKRLRIQMNEIMRSIEETYCDSYYERVDS